MEGKSETVPCDPFLYVDVLQSNYRGRKYDENVLNLYFPYRESK